MLFAISILYILYKKRYTGVLSRYRFTSKMLFGLAFSITKGSNSTAIWAHPYAQRLIASQKACSAPQRLAARFVVRGKLTTRDAGEGTLACF